MCIFGGFCFWLAAIYINTRTDKMSIHDLPTATAPTIVITFRSKKTITTTTAYYDD